MRKESSNHHSTFKKKLIIQKTDGVMSPSYRQFSSTKLTKSRSNKLLKIISSPMSLNKCMDLEPIGNHKLQELSTSELRRSTKTASSHSRSRILKSLSTSILKHPKLKFGLKSSNSLTELKTFQNLKKSSKN